MIVDTNKLNKQENYSLLTSTIIPRPIAFVSTCGTDGSTNIAPFSFFNGVTSSPPILSISIGKKKDGSDKDTLKNIKETKEFVVHIISDDISKQMNDSAKDYDYGIWAPLITGYTHNITSF